MLHQILDVDVCQSVQLLLVLSVVMTLTPKKHILTPLFSSLYKLLCSQEIYRPEIPNSLYEVNELKCNSINVFSCTSCLRSPPLYTPPPLPALSTPPSPPVVLLLRLLRQMVQPFLLFTHRP